MDSVVTSYPAPGRRLEPDASAVLRADRESMPAWLARFSPGDAFDRAAFMASRVVFYPGSGFDGDPVKVFGATGFAHCFIYADYLVSREQIEAALDGEQEGFRGYRSLARLHLDQRDLLPVEWRVHGLTDLDLKRRYPFGSVPPFGLLEVLERRDDFDAAHGPARLAVLFLGAEGVTAYAALFCRADSPGAPFVVVVQDHGFGCNWTRFDADGQLAALARRSKRLPEWLMVARNSLAWRGYEPVDAGAGAVGGRGRSLWRRG